MLELKIGTAESGMGWMEFVSSMTGSLAWPVALVIVAILFRTHIVGLFRRVEEIGFGGATAKLGKELDKAEQIATTIPEPPAEPELEPPVLPSDAVESERTDDYRERNHHDIKPANRPEQYFRINEETFEDLLGISSSAAILEAWAPVERALHRLARNNGWTERRSQRTSPAGLAEDLANKGKLPITVVTMIAELQRIRGLAAHQGEVTTRDAIRFKRLAEEALHNLMYKWDQ
jgi:hypothetical protein